VCLSVGQRDLASVAECGSVRSPADPVLCDVVTRLTASDPETKPRHSFVELDMVDFTGRGFEGFHVRFGELHGAAPKLGSIWEALRVRPTAFQFPLISYHFVFAREIASKMLPSSHHFPLKS
jgi:hypothetical protein